MRAGSAFTPVQTADGRKVNVADDVNYTIVILYDLRTGEPLAFMHETYLSGLRVGATTALAVSIAAREDAEVLGLFGTGMQAMPSCRAICSVRPIKRVKVFSPNPAHRAAFVKEMAGEKFEVVAVDDPREVVRGAHVIACNTNSKVPVLQGEWLEPGQMLVTIGNSDVSNPRHEVDETTFARASEIIINDWDSVAANRQIELSGPIAKGVVKRENVHELGDVVTGKVTLKRDPGGIIFYKNNTGLAIQFAACGAILHRKLWPRAPTAPFRPSGSRAASRTSDQRLRDQRLCARTTLMNSRMRARCSLIRPGGPHKYMKNIRNLRS